MTQKAVDITVENICLGSLEVVAYTASHGLLGRDVLNRLRILLDGPARTLEFL